MLSQKLDSCAPQKIFSRSNTFFMKSKWIFSRCVVEGEIDFSLGKGRSLSILIPLKPELLLQQQTKLQEQLLCVLLPSCTGWVYMLVCWWVCQGAQMTKLLKLPKRETFVETAAASIDASAVVMLLQLPQWSFKIPKLWIKNIFKTLLT